MKTPQRALRAAAITARVFLFMAMLLGMLWICLRALLVGIVLHPALATIRAHTVRGWSNYEVAVSSSWWYGGGIMELSGVRIKPLAHHSMLSFVHFPTLIVTISVGVPLTGSLMRDLYGIGMEADIALPSNSRGLSSKDTPSVPKSMPSYRWAQRLLHINTVAVSNATIKISRDSQVVGAIQNATFTITRQKQTNVLMITGQGKLVLNQQAYRVMVLLEHDWNTSWVVKRCIIVRQGGRVSMTGTLRTAELLQDWEYAITVRGSRSILEEMQSVLPVLVLPSGTAETSTMKIEKKGTDLSCWVVDE